jgi:oligopeptidase A
VSNPLLEPSALPAFSAIRPKHVEPAVNEVLENNRRELDEILRQAASESPKFESSILALENLSDKLHQVWSPVSHLHAVANSPELRQAYNNCLSALACYETDLAQNEALCRLYNHVASNLSGDRNDGADRLLQLAIRDFRLTGVTLPEKEKQRFKGIMEELTQLQAKFEQNVLDSMAAWTHHETLRENLTGLPDALLEQAETNAAEASLSGWLFRLDQPTYTAIITQADHRELRYQIYRAWVTRASDQISEGAEYDNSENIANILRLRHEAAKLIGFCNFAEYSLATKMAETTEQVHDFLEGLAKRARPAAVRELEELEKFAGKALAAWDVAYYSEQLRQHKYSISDQELRPYFPLDTVLNGLFRLVRDIYGIEIRAVEGIDTWASEVRFYSLCNESGEQFGGFYADFFARPNKRSGAWMDECTIRKSMNGDSRMPVAHLVCNFSAPTANMPCQLTHEEVLTLFHEFGHSLHHMLTRVDYPSVSGINGVPWDAVELPSQFMENFAWQPQVVEMISGHYLTGESLPNDLLEKLRASRVFQAGISMVRQLEFALFDLRLHAEYDPRRGPRLTELTEQVRRAVAVVRQPEFNRFAHSFSHVFGGGYAAGYYSYKWAEVLAADAWSAFEDAGYMNTEIAARFRREILEIGGTVDIGEAFKNFRGRSPELEPLLRQSGISDSSEVSNR